MQAEEEETEGTEALNVKVGKEPPAVSKEERDEHEASGHAQYRSWCAHCVAAWGLGNQQRLVQHARDETPVVSSDFYFMGEEDETAAPYLAIIDGRSRSVHAVALPDKKATTLSNVRAFASFVKGLGYTRIVNKSDGEPAMVALKTAAAKFAAVEAVPEQSPVGDHKANGAVENAVKEIKRRQRAIRSSLESRLGFKLKEDDPVLDWIPQHAAAQINRFKIGEDGRTPDQRRTGKVWRKKMPLFGERIMVKEAGSKGRRNDAAMRMLPGRYVGHHNKHGSVLILTEEGLKVGSNYHRLPDAEAWIREGWEDLKGRPWDVRPYQRTAPSRARQVQNEPNEKSGSKEVEPIPVTTVTQQETLGTFRVMRWMVTDFGASPGCDGCISLNRPGFQQKPHEPFCRERMEEKWNAREEARVAKGEAPSVAPRAPLRKKGADSNRKSTPMEVEESKDGLRKRAASKGAEELRSDETPVEPALAQRVTSASASPTGVAVGAQMQLIGAPTGAEGTGPVPMDADAAVDETDVAMGEDDPGTGGVFGSAGEAAALDLCHLERVEVKELDSFKRILKPYVAEAVEEKFQAEEVELTLREKDEIANLLLHLSAVDVMEVFSPKRFTALAGAFGLKPGVAVDLEELKPGGEDFWDLDRQGDVEEVEKLIDLEEPRLLTGSPPCEAFSRLLNISKHRRSPEAIQNQKDVGRRRLHVAIKFYRKQHEAGRYFLHEHPDSAESWKDGEMMNLMDVEGVYVVKGPMCRWEMQATDRRGLQGTGYVKKMTRWVTNCWALAQLLEGVCEAESGGVWHRHIHLIGGIAKQAQVYPPKLVKAVLKGLRDQLRADGEISAFEEYAAGPTPEHPWFEGLEEDWQTFVDDSAGTPLRTDLVMAARQEELEWIRSEGIYRKVPLRVCLERGFKPIDTKWLDINKGDDNEPNYRSRMVAREIKARKKPEEKLEASSLFMATPPIEAFFMLLSLWMSIRVSKRGKPLKLGLWDVSRAHFMGKAQREVYVTIPEEDRDESDTEPMVGRLERSMYGTQDASNIWQHDYVKLCEENGYAFGKANFATMYHEEDEARGLVHGDDFILLADDDGIEHMDKILTSKYKVKMLAKIGPDATDAKEGSFLNRVIRYFGPEVDGDERVEIEADSRHAELIVKSLNLQNAKSVETPSVKRSLAEVQATEAEEVLPAKEATTFRSGVMRGAYLSQDRTDICEAVKSLSSAMRNPKPGDMARLKRLGRYLIGKPLAVRVMRRQTMPSTLAMSGDSDWAGEMVTRKSTSGMIAMLGRHLIAGKSNLQSTIALSSCEAEFYAMTKATASGLFLRAILNDWGLGDIELEVGTDSSSAKAFGERRGLGKNRHVQTKYLWIQERIATKDMKLKKINTKNNLSDIMTKSLGSEDLKRHLSNMSFEFRSSKSGKQKALLT